jgi:hypothetical protein
LDQRVREETGRERAIRKSEPPVVLQPAESAQKVFNGSERRVRASGEELGAKQVQGREPTGIHQIVTCASISVTPAKQKSDTVERGRRCCQWHDDPVGVVSEEDDEDEDYLTWIELSDDD